MITKIDMAYAKKQIAPDGTHYTVIRRPRGLGDSIERFLHSGIMGKIVKAITGKDEPCGSCRSRRDLLNKLVPYKGESK